MLDELPCRAQGFYEFEVEIEFYEIFDELITDLLRPDNQVSVPIERGSYFVDGSPSRASAYRALSAWVSIHNSSLSRKTE